MLVERRIQTPTLTGVVNIGWPDSSKTTSTKFPPYDLITIDEYNFTIVLAVAGYKRENIKIAVDKSILSIKGDWPGEKLAEGVVYQVNGIAKRSFALFFKLGEYMEVESAKSEDGLLTVKVKKNLPEDKKPVVIDIQ